MGTLLFVLVCGGSLLWDSGFFYPDNHHIVLQFIINNGKTANPDESHSLKGVRHHWMALIFNILYLNRKVLWLFLLHA